MAVQGAMPAWFRLDRHEGEGATPPADTAPATGATDPDDTHAEALLADAVASLGDAGKKALAEERAARKAAEKERADLAARLKEFEDRDKTEAQKLAERAEAAEERVQAATARAVKAEVKALAADQFADPADAAAFLDLSKYVGADGEVDSDAISADLTDLLERKPHLKKVAAGPRNPAPDLSQGRGGNNGPTDFRKAPKAEVDAELAKYGIRSRSR